MRPLPCLVLLVLLLAVRVPSAGAEESDPLTAEQVDALLRRVGSYETSREDTDAAWQGLEAQGWARLSPMLDLRRWAHPASRRGALSVATRIGNGAAVHHLALQAIRVGNEEADDELAMDGLQLLEAALRPGGLESEAGAVQRQSPPGADPRRLTWQEAWWPDLLRELHRMRVIHIDGFYSGPGWPSERLESILAEQIHGHEAGLLDAAAHREWRVRMMALPLLGATRTGRTPAVREALRTALRDPVEKVRLAAINAVWGGRWTDLVPDLAERVLDEGERDEVRIRAVKAVAASGAPAAEPTVLRALDAESVAVRAAAASHASELPRSPPLVAALLERLRDRHPEMRAGAAEGLGGASGWGRADLLDVPVDAEDLLGLIHDPSDLVRFRVWEIAAQKRAVPATWAPRLIERLVAGGRWESEGAALALASLGQSAQPVLEDMRDARREVPEPVRRSLARAIEAVEMSLLPKEAVRAQLNAEEPARRLRAVREVIRRQDDSWLLELLGHRDPEVAVRAAGHLVRDPAHTQAVVETLLRIFPDVRGYRGYHLFHRLGDRLLPHLSQLLARYDQEPTDVWFDLLQRVERSEPLLADRVWASYVTAPTPRTARRVGQMGDRFFARILRRLRSADAATRASALPVLPHVPPGCLRDHFLEIQALRGGLDAEDPARRALEEALEKADVRYARGPHHPWLDLR